MHASFTQGFTRIAFCIKFGSKKKVRVPTALWKQDQVIQSSSSRKKFIWAQFLKEPHFLWLIKLDRTSAWKCWRSINMETIQATFHIAWYEKKMCWTLVCGKFVIVSTLSQPSPFSTLSMHERETSRESLADQYYYFLCDFRVRWWSILSLFKKHCLRQDGLKNSGTLHLNLLELPWLQQFTLIRIKGTIVSSVQN